MELQKCRLVALLCSVWVFLVNGMTVEVCVYLFPRVVSVDVGKKTKNRGMVAVKIKK